SPTRRQSTNGVGAVGVAAHGGDETKDRSRCLGEKTGPGTTRAALLYSEHAPPPLLHVRRKSVNTKECVGVPSSEHVAEIVGRQGCKIKALRAKTNTYIKTPVRGEQPVFVVSGRKEDVAMAKREILSAAEHFSQIRASRNKAGPLAGTAPGCLAAAPNLPGQTTIQVRVPYRVVGLVVGPKGATIKRIQQQTHTYIVTPSRDKEPVFEVTGMPENVDRAREEIEAHITLRTGSSVELSGDKNDFHYNGTDVSFEASIGGGWLHSLLSAGVQGGGASAQLTAGYRNDSSSSVGSSSSDSFYSGGGRMADFSPTSPFNSNNGNCSGGSFWFGESLLSLGSEDLAGMDSRSFDGLSMAPVVWNPLEQGIQLFDARHAPLRDSQPETPRLSPTFQETLEHPMAKLVQSSFSSEEHGFSGYRAAFSCSSDSTASSSPPDQPFSVMPRRLRWRCEPIRPTCLVQLTRCRGGTGGARVPGIIFKM
uniref:K Homology domain-containing protein n=1 Tax=Denticeps clupeoides TaxID=299321 RepID=A0AAY4CIL8_9TELE